MKLRSTAIGFVLFMAVAGRCQAQAPKALEMLKNVEKGFEGVQDFIATIEAEVDMERVRVPKMNATMYFKKPDKVHFSSSSFAMLPREGIALNPSLLRARYEPTLLGEDTVDGKRLFKMQLTGKEQNVRARQLMLWIDPNAWTIVRMESVPYQGRVLRLAFAYALQAGSYWLPQTLKASFELAGRDTLQRQLDLDMQAPPQLDEMRRPIRSGTITVKYLDYKINVGLADDVFEKRGAMPKAQ